MILMAAVLLVKVIGVLFKMPMTSMIGATGRGYFSSAYEIYTPIFAIAMAGLPVAVSKMVAESVALSRYQEARNIFRVSKKVFMIVGIAGTAVLLIASWPYTALVGKPKALPAVLCVAPSIFLCCYMSAYRGYYEGLRNMKPTAVSQVIEALGKLVLGLVFIKIIIVAGTNSFNNTGVVFGQKVNDLTQANSIIMPYAAAGAVLGVTIGSGLSLLFLALHFRRYNDGFTGIQLADPQESKPDKSLSSEMIKIAIPMVISALVLNLTNLIDVTTVQSRLKSALENNPETVINMFRASLEAAESKKLLNLSVIEDVSSYIWGAYSAALDFKTLVPTITIQLGVSALPALATAWAIKNRDDIKSSIETVLRVGMIIAFPAGLGMAFLAKPILTLIYGGGNSADMVNVVAPMLVVYGVFTPIIAVSTPITSMLQAVGRADIPMKTVIGAAIFKIVCNFALVGIPGINIYGAVAGTVLFYVIIVSTNLFRLISITGVKINWKSIILKPCISALLCGVTAFAVNGLINIFFTSLSARVMSFVGCILGVCLGAIVYAVCLLFIKGVAREDVIVLPKGEKIAKLLEKYRLLG